MRAVANLGFLFTEELSCILARCNAAASAGFKAVEVDWPGNVTSEEFSKVLQSCKVSAVLINCFQGDKAAGECGFAAEPGKEEQFRDSLASTIQYATAIGCNKIHLLSGRDLASPAEQERTLISNLKEAVPALTKAGVTALIEPINPYSKPGYFLNNMSTAVRVVKAVASERVRLQLDLFHTQMIAGNITNIIKDVMPLVGHVQVAQAPHRHEPSAPGELNYEYIFNTLREAGYDGDVGCEYKPSTETTTGSLMWIKQYGLQL